MQRASHASVNGCAPSGLAWRRAVLALLLAALAGCKVAVFSKLSEPEANDVLYTLLQGGLDAEKRPDGDGAYGVWTGKSDLVKAMALLKANAQPEQKHPTLGELFGRNQLISTPAEERIRFVYGTEQALGQTLSKIDGVLVARVHIVLPINDPLATEVKPSSASVFIKYRPDRDMASAVPAVKDLVVRSIEGLSVDRVAVTLFPAASVRPAAALEADAALQPAGESPQFLGVSVPASSVGELRLRFMLAIGIAAALVFVLLRMARGGVRAAAAAQAPAGRRSTRPAGSGA
jgi:type III secretion protein J